MYLILNLEEKEAIHNGQSHRLGIGITSIGVSHHFKARQKNCSC
jgi:hypothetical protein